MISEERLKELIEQCSIVYDYNADIGVDEINLKDTHLDYVQDEPCVYAHSKHYNMRFTYFTEDLYETKEEAEFVAKYHCSKTIKFEPLTFEEFIKYVEFGITPFHLPESIEIDINEDWKMFYVITAYTPAKNFEYIEDKDKRRAYYQAVEYAKKLFLGEE